MVICESGRAVVDAVAQIENDVGVVGFRKRVAVHSSAPASREFRVHIESGGERVVNPAWPPRPHENSVTDRRLAAGFLSGPTVGINITFPKSPMPVPLR